MKVTVERAQLLKSLGHVHRVVERRNTIPILGNVLVRAENAKLSLKATDLDLEVTETLAAESATGGPRPWPEQRVTCPRCRRSCTPTACARCQVARSSGWKATATARSGRPAPAAR